MSLDRIHHRIVFTCDTCDDTLETDETDFPDALQVLKFSGWEARKERGDWVHECPGCQRVVF